VAKQKIEAGDQKLGQMMQQFRQEAGISQEWLSAEMHIGARSGKLGRFEKGEQMPTADELRRLCAKLVLPVDRQDRLWERAVAVWRRVDTSPRIYRFDDFKMMPGLIAYLRWLYQKPVADAGGVLVKRKNLEYLVEYPVAFFPAHGAALESVLPQENVEARPDHVISDSNLCKDAGPRLAWNKLRETPLTEERMTEGWNLCFDTLTVTGDRPVLTARLGYYGQIQDSCESLMHEIFQVFDEHPLTPADVHEFPNVLKRLPLRKRIHDLEANPITQARHRAAGIGVIAPIFFMDHTGTWRTIVERRSAHVAALQKAMTLAPAGMLGFSRGGVDRIPDGTPHCPWGSYQARDVELAILVEYAEELFDEEPTGYIGREAFYNHPPIHALLNTYHAQVVFTGLSIDLLSLQAQICAIIFVPSKQWLNDTKFKLNYEWEYVDYNSPARQRAFTSIMTDDGGIVKMRPETTAPSGAAAFWYGVDEARRRIDSLT
jgi:transcriptional regulator with XRE-family HTH domain